MPQEKFIVEIKCSDSRCLPFKKYLTDSGFDLRSNEAGSVIMLPGQIAVFHTGVHINLPKGLEGQIRSRSGLAFIKGVVVTGGMGTIDLGYVGELLVCLINLGTNPVTINQYDKIAQLCFAIVPDVSLVPVDFNTESPDQNVRGNKGFGSTG